MKQRLIAWGSLAALVALVGLLAVYFAGNGTSETEKESDLRKPVVIPEAKPEIPTSRPAAEPEPKAEKVKPEKKAKSGLWDVL